MIFVARADGGVTYVSPEWSAFTGRAADTAVEHGWLGCVHPEDREMAVTFLRTARDRRSEYSLRLRMRRADGSHAWVMIGAVPSFGPPNRSFLGYLGSMTEVNFADSDPLVAHGTHARFVPPPTHPATPPGTTLERVADHLLMAHGLVEEDGAKELLPILRRALMMAGRLLAREMVARSPGDRSH
ncbi:PAS domain-containing protein [Methylobacterium sp. yr668]|uniref:PAS domain-containing protein n=1 Tax=Methylobacterium sp. yr668 TaxID=1761801 RepID=UPI0008E619DE|nr:PAS domain-containing protein [Methylobacterium sp. yr668]SFT29228.1 PAS domain S-box-containing protein [Methylobacterium sp. yr668]